MALTREDLLAISQLLDERLNPINKRLDGMDKRFDGMDERLDRMDERLDSMDERLLNVENNMVTKDYLEKQLKKSENMILNEIDRVQEKTNEKFKNMQFSIL